MSMGSPPAPPGPEIRTGQQLSPPLSPQRLFHGRLERFVLFGKFVRFRASAHLIEIPHALPQMLDTAFILGDAVKTRDTSLD